MHRVGEFAALTGVSVRALHHYDRFGLLPPSAYSDSGYRLYTQRDLLRLQQILTLRYLGFSLRQIGALLSRPDFDLMASMRVQRGALRDRISELEQIESAVGELLEHRLATGAWNWGLAAKASAAVQGSLAQKGESMNDYYSPEEMQQQFEELGKQITPEEIREVEQRWQALLTEVHASRHLDPASPEAQQLAARWEELIQATFRGNEKLMASVGNQYRQGAFSEVEGTPEPEDFAFIGRAIEARTGMK